MIEKVVLFDQKMGTYWEERYVARLDSEGCRKFLGLSQDETDREKALSKLTDREKALLKLK